MIGQKVGSREKGEGRREKGSRSGIILYYQVLGILFVAFDITITRPSHKSDSANVSLPLSAKPLDSLPDGYETV